MKQGLRPGGEDGDGFGKANGEGVGSEFDDVGEELKRQDLDIARNCARQILK